MNWQDQILESHKGQTGFFKTIEKKSKMENLKQRLTRGENIEFESENDMMTLSFNKSFGGNEFFWIELNCKFIHSSKTFGSFEKKLNKLLIERDLIEC